MEVPLEKSKKILITGGARSGKSQYALNMAALYGKRKAYLATAQPLDHEMQKRIENHRRMRGKDWITIEEPLRVSQVLKEIGESCDVVILDCLTLWISNLLTNYKTDQRVIINEIKKLAQSAREFKGTLVIVSNEVGMGIVPENRLSRQFQDLAGYANQKIAEVVDEVIIMVSGIPLKVK